MNHFAWRAGVLWIAAVAAPGPSRVPDAPQHWVSAWIMAPAQPGTLAGPFHAAGALRNRTVRNIVHTAIAGRELRLRLSNLFGSGPLTLGAVYVGMQQRWPALRKGSNRPVTFGGSGSVVIPEGATAITDPVSLSFGAGENLAVSIYVAAADGPATTHPAAYQVSFISKPGNFAASEDGSGFTEAAGSCFYAVGIDAAGGARGAIVALGDSITDGDGSTMNSNHRWPDLLARRAALPVLNAGIGGNRVLSSSPCFGDNTLARIHRDVWAQTGVRAVILLQGVNDIIHPEMRLAAGEERLRTCIASRQVTADELIAGYRQIAAQAHARGVKILGGTILPFQGFRSWTQVQEAKRQAVNRWIKTGGAFDGVIDFAAAVADPRNPLRLARFADSGDHLHPNDAGYQAMANAVDLNLLRAAVQ